MKVLAFTLNLLIQEWFFLAVRLTHRIPSHLGNIWVVAANGRDLYTSLRIGLHFGVAWEIIPLSSLEFVKDQGSCPVLDKLSVLNEARIQSSYTFIGNFEVGLATCSLPDLMMLHFLRLVNMPWLTWPFVLFCLGTREAGILSRWFAVCRNQSISPTVSCVRPFDLGSSLVGRWEAALGLVAWLLQTIVHVFGIACQAFDQAVSLEYFEGELALMFFLKLRSHQ